MIGGSQRIASEQMGAPFDADSLADNPLEGYTLATKLDSFLMDT